MLRILHVIGAMDRGGAETAVMNLYRQIDRSRIQFDFLVHEQRECDFDEEIASMGGKFLRLPRFNGINEHSYRMKCRKIFAEHEEYQIVHGHIGSCASIYLDEANKAGRYTIAHSHAQFFLKGARGLAFRLLTHSTRNIADYFMACSYEAGLDRFGKDIVNGNRFSILYNGIDLAGYHCSEEEHLAAKSQLHLSRRPVFGHVGRLAEEKNHLFLLDAFKHILDDLPDAVLLLAGRGPLESKLKSWCVKHGIDKSVIFLGVRDDIPELLRAMDVFIMPSTKEGLAIAAVEAQASGLPCLISDGIPELTVMAPNSKRLPLNAGSREWANEAIRAYEITQSSARHDNIELIRSKGFDIAETAKWLTNYYENAAIEAAKKTSLI